MSSFGYFSHGNSPLLEGNVDRQIIVVQTWYMADIFSKINKVILSFQSQLAAFVVHHKRQAFKWKCKFGKMWVWELPNTFRMRSVVIGLTPGSAGVTPELSVRSNPWAQVGWSQNKNNTEGLHWHISNEKRDDL